MQSTPFIVRSLTTPGECLRPALDEAFALHYGDEATSSVLDGGNGPPDSSELWSTVKEYQGKSIERGQQATSETRIPEM